MPSKTNKTSRASAPRQTSLSPSERKIVSARLKTLNSTQNVIRKKSK